jgi:hypothetical protein
VSLLFDYRVFSYTHSPALSAIGQEVCYLDLFYRLLIGCDVFQGLVSGKLSMKKKKVPSLVEKWQNVQKEVASKSKDSDD